MTENWRDPPQLTQFFMKWKYWYLAIDTFHWVTQVPQRCKDERYCILYIILNVEFWFLSLFKKVKLVSCQETIEH